MKNQNLFIDNAEILDRLIEILNNVIKKLQNQQKMD
jgi:hypothetical protein